MSNARYFANGTDFYRVIYDTGSIEGPYIRFHAAKRVGESGIKVRRRYSYSGTLLHEWQQYESYKVQKLVPVYAECDLVGCTPGLCFGGHGLTLDWQDVTE